MESYAQCLIMKKNILVLGYSRACVANDQNHYVSWLTMIIKVLGHGKNINSGFKKIKGKFQKAVNVPSIVSLQKMGSVKNFLNLPFLKAIESNVGCDIVVLEPSYKILNLMGYNRR